MYEERQRPTLLRPPEFARFGRLVHMSASGEWRFVADLAAYEQAHNPDHAVYSPFAGGGLPDSDPYGVLEEPGGSIVADAGGPDGEVYRTNHGLSAGAGEVLRIER